jgi:ArsR family transcriptional regulator
MFIFEVKVLDLIQVMKALSDETRIRILNVLKDGDLCVCELESILDISQSNVSRHLNKLTNAKVIDYYKVNKYVYYKINSEALEEFNFIKDLIETQTMKLKKCQSDIEKLTLYKSSGLGCDDLKEGKGCFGIIDN